jgi:two-component system, OmpR family, response regulator
MGSVLIIEGDVELQECLKEIVISNGHEALVAANGGEGLRIFRELFPSLIIVDLSPPGMEGMEVLRELRTEKSVPKIIALSDAPPDELLLKSAQKLGAQKILVKPFTAAQFLVVIQSPLVA